MPLATIKIVENVFDKNEKQQLIEKVSEAIISVEGESLREKTVVLIDEVKSGDWGFGGRSLTTQQISSLRTQ